MVNDSRIYEHRGEVQDLGNGVYQLPTDYPEVCNAPLWTYLLAEQERFALIDPGVQSTYVSTLRHAILEVGFDVRDADLLLATHGHPDHSGGLSSWTRELRGVRVAAPLEDAPWVESFERQWKMFWDDYPGTLDLSTSREFIRGLSVPEAKVDILLRNEDVVGVGARMFEVIETRGHTWGHCAYFDRRSGSLFTGDAVQGRGTASSDGTVVYAPLYLDVADAREGLNKLLEVPFTQMCPAHRPPMSREDGLAFIRESLQFIDEVDEIARALVARSSSAGVLTSELAINIADLVHCDPPLTAQTVPTARAHLYSLAREGLIEAAWKLRVTSKHDHDVL